MKRKFFPFFYFLLSLVVVPFEMVCSIICLVQLRFIGSLVLLLCSAVYCFLFIPIVFRVITITNLFIKVSKDKVLFKKPVQYPVDVKIGDIDSIDLELVHFKNTHLEYYNYGVGGYYGFDYFLLIILKNKQEERIMLSGFTHIGILKIVKTIISINKNITTGKSLNEYLRMYKKRYDRIKV